MKMHNTTRLTTVRRMKMTEEEIQEWLKTCPDHRWDEVQRFEGVVWIRFCVEEEDEDERNNI